jgi:hypothetical protein
MLCCDDLSGLKILGASNAHSSKERDKVVFGTASSAHTACLIPGETWTGISGMWLVLSWHTAAWKQGLNEHRCASIQEKCPSA